LNLKLFTLSLNRRGYRVLLAADGYHGFVLAHDGRPDLIIMDVQLPTLSGLEVTRTLKESINIKNIPVVIATAFLIDQETLRKSRCDAYMPKPASPITRPGMSPIFFPGTGSPSSPIAPPLNWRLHRALTERPRPAREAPTPALTSPAAPAGDPTVISLK
jgi:two-component system, cell cycle response regulator DivK